MSVPGVGGDARTTVLRPGVVDGRTTMDEGGKLGLDGWMDGWMGEAVFSPRSSMEVLAPNDEKVSRMVALKKRLVVTCRRVLAFFKKIEH